MSKNNKKNNVSSHGNVSETEEQKISVLEKVYQSSDAFETPRGRPSLIPLMIVSILFGFLSGLLALFLALSGGLQRIPLFNQFEINTLMPNSAITIARTEKVTVTANERVDAVVEKSFDVTYGIYNAKKLTLTIDGLLAAAESPFATAVAVTNDGWLVTSAPLNEKLTDYAIVNHDGDTFPIIARKDDALTGLTFLRIRAEGMPVANFAQGRSSVVVGSTALVPQFQIGMHHSAFPVSFTAFIQPSVRSSDRLQMRIALSRLLPDALAGAPVFTLDGLVAGVVASHDDETLYDEAVPVFSIGAFLSQLSHDGEVSHPRLGVHYLELSSTAHLVFDTVQDRRSGALLIDAGSVPAVEKRSNADVAGLQKGDIITKIDDELINDISDLATVIQSYKPDASVVITYFRGGEEQTAVASLSSQGNDQTTTSSNKP